MRVLFSWKKHLGAKNKLLVAIEYKLGKVVHRDGARWWPVRVQGWGDSINGFKNDDT